ncbi:MAG: TrmH family RNA methyltransferase [Gemmatimonadaceae bacterium]
MKLLTMARDLHRRRARERSGLFLAEGIRTVEELLSSGLPLRGALISPSLSETERGLDLARRLAVSAAAAAYELAHISDYELGSAAATESPQGVLVLAARPERSFEELLPRVRLLIVVLDGVQDPGNVGTILRTAAAFGASATVALAGTADLWNPKVVRSAMGALFTQHAFASSAESLLDYCRINAVELWTTSASGERLEPRSGAPDRLALVVGNEGNGVSGAMTRAADRAVTIPIRAVESLNVAVATGILLYTLTA